MALDCPWHVAYLRDRQSEAAAKIDGGRWQKSYSGKDSSIKYFDRVWCRTSTLSCHIINTSNFIQFFQRSYPIVHMSSGLGVATQEMERKWAPQIKIQCSEYSQLHLQNVLLRVSFVGHENEVVYIWRVHFLELGGNEH